MERSGQALVVDCQAVSRPHRGSHQVTMVCCTSATGEAEQVNRMGDGGECQTSDRVISNMSHCIPHGRQWLRPQDMLGGVPTVDITDIAFSLSRQLLFFISNAKTCCFAPLLFSESNFICVIPHLNRCRGLPSPSLLSMSYVGSTRW